MSKASDKRYQRFCSHGPFRELVEHMQSTMKLGEQTLCEQDFYDAAKAAMEIRHRDVRKIEDDPLMAHNTVLPMERASYTRTAAHAIIPMLWRRRHEAELVRNTLRGWIESLRRDRKGQVP